MTITRATVPTAWEPLLSQYLAHCRASGHTKQSIESTRQRLGHMMRRIECDPADLRKRKLTEWLGSQTWAQETRRGRHNTFRGFFKWARKRGLIERNLAGALPRVSAAAPNPMPCPERVYKEAVMRSDARARLILRLASEEGLRRSEIAQVHSDHLVEDLIGWSLIVKGKGGKTRVLPLTPGIAQALRDLPEGHAFPGADDGHLSPRRVGEIGAGALEGKWTLHKLRHKFATATYRIDRDLLAVQQLLGHSTPATTQVYVAVDREHLRKTLLAAAV